jgi:GNAT superfamily N-acetyltransferase
MFDIDKAIVRIAKRKDKLALVDVSKGIWDGNDYLPNLLDRWIAEPYFFVCEFQGKVVGCIKLSIFPDNVLWIEGLRVHVKYQGWGIAKLLNQHVFNFSQRLVKENPLLRFEFCTYYKNIESLRLTQKLGFRISEQFYNLCKRGVKHVIKPLILEDYGMDSFLDLDRFIPLGWQSVHRVTASISYIKKNAILFQTPRSTYLLGGLAEKSITLLHAPITDIEDELPYFQYFFGSRKSISIILSEKYEHCIPSLLDKHFFFWDETREVAKNMLIFTLPDSIR